MSARTLYSPFKKEIFPASIIYKTVPEYLLDCVQEAIHKGEEDWIVDGVSGKRRKFIDVEVTTRRIGSAMYKRGLRKGDTVLYLTYDMYHIHSIILGVWRANGTLRASYPEDNEETLLERVEESQVKWIICEVDSSEMCLSVASRVSWDMEVFVVGEAIGCTPIDVLFNDNGLELPILELSPLDTAFIFCTSGTTGNSKGAVHTHSSIIHQILSLRYNPWSVDGNLIASKGTHIMGTIVPLTILSIGRTCIVVGKITKENFSRAVTDFKPALVFGFAPFLLSLLDANDTSYDLSSIQIISVGGSPLTAAMENSFKKAPNVELVLNSYGLTEILPIASDIQLSSDVAAKFTATPTGSIGKVYAGVALQIRNPDTREILAPYKRGEIWVKSPTQMSGYYKNSKTTRLPYVLDPIGNLEGTISRAAYVGSKQYEDIKELKTLVKVELEKVIPEIATFTIWWKFSKQLLLKDAQANEIAFYDGWVLTGDVGYYDENEFIFIEDRIKEIFKYYGSHVSPSELEGIISKHPAVAEACVIAIDDPIGVDKIPRAFVTLNEHHLKRSMELPEEIMHFVNKQVADYKRLRGGLFIIEELPKGKTGKVSRQLLADQSVLSPISF